MGESFRTYFCHYSLSPILWFDSFSSQRVVSVWIRLSGFFFFLHFSLGDLVGMRRPAVGLADHAC